jgi:oligogalacturonide lyase
MKYKFLPFVCLLLQLTVRAQELMETGPKKPMPDEWIDKDTHHKVVRLSRKDGNNLSFYFHNNPFIGNKMIFYSTDSAGRQIYTVDLKTLKIDRVTQRGYGPGMGGRPGGPGGEIVGVGSRSVYYQVKDSVYATNIDTHQTRLIFVFPADFKATVVTLNADETLMAGVRADDAEREILRQYPEKSQFFDRIYEAHLPHVLFTINTKTGELKKIHTENDWTNHVQFSPTDPDLLMFCHEGPWHKVDRIWTIRLKTGEIRLMHKRTVDNEIAGHEFFSPDGKKIYFDWQIPRSQNFYLGAVDVNTLEEKKYQMTRDEWSIHFTVSRDEKLYAGDGGDAGQVAKAKDGRWIYLFRPEGDHFVSERLVNMKDQNYKLEPNVHFSPDSKWVIFRANFEGKEEVYAVELKKS